MSSSASPAAANGTITIVLADDHHVVRMGVPLLLDAEDGFAVVGEAADADAALRSVLGHKPAVLVLDLNMPGETTSLKAIPRVRERSPGTAVVVLTMQEDPSFARHALQAGAAGYVLKDSANAGSARSSSSRSARSSRTARTSSRSSGTPRAPSSCATPSTTGCWPTRDRRDASYLRLGGGRRAR